MVTTRQKHQRADSRRKHHSPPPPPKPAFLEHSGIEEGWPKTKMRPAKWASGFAAAQDEDGEDAEQEWQGDSVQADGLEDGSPRDELGVAEPVEG